MTTNNIITQNNFQSPKQYTEELPTFGSKSFTPKTMLANGLSPLNTNQDSRQYGIAEKSHEDFGQYASEVGEKRLGNDNVQEYQRLLRGLKNEDDGGVTESEDYEVLDE